MYQYTDLLTRLTNFKIENKNFLLFKNTIGHIRLIQMWMLNQCVPLYAIYIDIPMDKYL